MKKIFVLLALVFLVSGCTVAKENNLDKVINDVLTSNDNLKNQNFSGYDYYLPRGVSLIHKLDYNTTFLYKSNKIYFYVDIISYYHKVEKKYEENKDIYFSKLISNDGKKGIINIIEQGKKYYVEIEYNYGKIETYTNKDDLTSTIVNSINILKTLDFNDNVIDSLIGENKIEYKEEKFDLFESSDANNGYLEIIDDKDKYKDNNDDDILIDDEKIEIEEEEELYN